MLFFYLASVFILVHRTAVYKNFGSFSAGTGKNQGLQKERGCFLWLIQETLANPVLSLFLSQAVCVMPSNSIKAFGRWPLTAYNSFSGCSAWDMWALTCSSCYSPYSHWNQWKLWLLSMFVSIAEECARGEGESSWILVSPFSLILPVLDYQWLIYAICEKLHVGIYSEKNASLGLCEVF